MKKNETKGSNVSDPSVHVVDVTNTWVFKFFTPVFFLPHLYFYNNLEFLNSFEFCMYPVNAEREEWNIYLKGAWG